MRLMVSHRALASSLVVITIAIIGFCFAATERTVYLSPEGENLWSGNCQIESCSPTSPCALSDDVITLSGESGCTIVFTNGTYGNTTLVSPPVEGTVWAVFVRLKGLVSGLDLGVYGISTLSVASLDSSKPSPAELIDSIIVMNPKRSFIPLAFELRSFNSINSFYVVQHDADTVEDGATIFGVDLNMKMTSSSPEICPQSTHVQPQYRNEVSLAVASFAGPVPSFNARSNPVMFVDSVIELPLFGKIGLLNFVNRAVLGDTIVVASSVYNAAFIAKATDPSRSMISLGPGLFPNLGVVVDTSVTRSFLSSWTAENALTVTFKTAIVNGVGPDGFGQILTSGTVCAHIEANGLSKFSRMDMNWDTSYEKNDDVSYRCRFEASSSTFDNPRIKFLGGARAASPTVKLTSVSINIDEEDSSIVFDGVHVDAIDLTLWKGTENRKILVSSLTTLHRETAFLYSRGVTFTRSSNLVLNFMHLKNAAEVKLPATVFKNATLLLGDSAMVVPGRSSLSWEVIDSVTIMSANGVDPKSQARLSLSGVNLMAATGWSVADGSPVFRTPSGPTAIVYAGSASELVRSAKLYWRGTAAPEPRTNYSLGLMLMSSTFDGSIDLESNYKLSSWVNPSNTSFHDLLFALSSSPQPANQPTNQPVFVPFSSSPTTNTPPSFPPSSPPTTSPSPVGTPPMPFAPLATHPVSATPVSSNPATRSPSPPSPGPHGTPSSLKNEEKKFLHILIIVAIIIAAILALLAAAVCIRLFCFKDRHPSEYQPIIQFHDSSPNFSYDPSGVSVLATHTHTLTR